MGYAHSSVGRLAANDHDRNVDLAQQTFGYAPEKQALHTTAPVRADNEQIGSEFLDHVRDLIGR